jgi:hypothetical protein
MAHTWSPHLSVHYAHPFPHWWHETTLSVQSKVHTAWVIRADRPRTPPKHHPARYGYLETACMSREMDRL